MKVHLETVDSFVWGKNVLSLSELSVDDDIQQVEKDYLEKYDPVYVSVRLPMESLSIISNFEQNGFSLIECQLRLLARLSKEYDISGINYRLEKVTSEDQLTEVLDIARSSVVHDRLSVDDAVPVWVSGRRYDAYVSQSFSRADEEVWGLFNVETGQIVAYRTHRIAAPQEALLLLGAVRSDLTGSGVGPICSYFYLNQLRLNGVKKAYTHISLINKPIFDLEVTRLGFRYQCVYAVLRKVYR
jgi:hypothetical protein